MLGYFGSIYYSIIYHKLKEILKCIKNAQIFGSIYYSIIYHKLKRILKCIKNAQIFYDI